jgi:hypothetical protein
LTICAYCSCDVSLNITFDVLAVTCRTGNEYRGKAEEVKGTITYVANEISLCIFSGSYASIFVVKYLNP